MFMSKLNQKEGVFSAVTSYLEEQGRDFDGAVVLSKEDNKTLIGMIAVALQEGTIEVSEAKASKMTEDKHYREYASNILNNWTRKDPRLNGGEKYETKRPGSRAGSGDEQVRELKKLKSTLTDEDQVAQVEAAIQERIAELKAERAKTKVKEIDFSLIPEFAHLAK